MKVEHVPYTLDSYDFPYQREFLSTAPAQPAVNLSLGACRDGYGDREMEPIHSTGSCSSRQPTSSTSSDTLRGWKAVRS